MGVLILGDTKVTYLDYSLGLSEPVELPLQIGINTNLSQVEIDTPGGQGTVVVPKDTLCKLFQMMLNHEF